MTDKRKKLLGSFGEDIAAKFLEKKGYKIIERNFSIRYGEIDIVALESGALVFIEVKTRKGDLFGGGIEAITPWKMQNLVRSAQFYKLKNPHLPDGLRIDAVAIQLSPEGVVADIELVKNLTG